MEIPKTTESKLYPEFIRNSEELKKFSRNKSVFSEIGLKNSHRKKGTLTVVFSSEGPQAMWDIATMSMRGISSCQSWTGYLGHCKKLIGTMIDPCAAIIYTTDGSVTKRGTLMRHRAVVRFVTKGRGKDKTRAILIEPVYGAWNGAASALDMFEDFIRSKTKNKYPIILSHSRGAMSGTGYVIPMTKQVRSISSKVRSYRDSRIPYSTSKTYYTDLSKIV